MRATGLIFVACLLAMSCSKEAERLSTGSPYTGYNNPNLALANKVIPEQFNTLADVLVQFPGVYVSDRGSSAEVLVSGRPVQFRVDDVIGCFSYFEANKFLNPNEIGQVEILRGYRSSYDYNVGAGILIHLHTRRKI